MNAPQLLAPLEIIVDVTEACSSFTLHCFSVDWNVWKLSSQFNSEMNSSFQGCQ